MANAVKVALETARGRRPHCTISILQVSRETWDEDEVIVVNFKCRTHGAEWRECVGGTTKLSCTTRVSAFSLEGPLEAEAKQCGDSDEDGFVDVD